MTHKPRQLFVLQALVSTILLAQTTINGSRTILGTWDASGASKTVPIKSGPLASRPSTCTASTEMYNVTNPTTGGQSLYVCNPVGNGWNLVGDGGSGSADVNQAGNNTFTGANDFSGSTVMKPFKAGTFASLPATCTAGDTYRVTDVTTGHGLLHCAATNTWKSFGASLIVGNAGTTGTTQYYLAKLTGAPSTAVLMSASDTSGAAGVVVSPSGTTGNALIARGGDVTCAFDGATTAGDYVQISSTAAGKCHDSGSSYPSSGQVLGRVLSTNATGGNYTMTLATQEAIPGGGGGSGVALSGTPAAGTLCFDGVNWVGPRAAQCGHDDFVGGSTSSLNVGALQWTLTALNSGTASNVYLPADAEEVGKFRIGVSTATAGHGQSLLLQPTNALANRTNWAFQFGFNLISTGAVRFRVGLTSQQSGIAPANFMGVGADDESTWDTSGNGVGNFKMYVCNAATAITSCDVYNTGVAQDTSNHYVKVSSPVTGTISITFDGTTTTFCASGCDVTTSHLPSTSTVFYPGWIIANQSTTAKTAAVNYYDYYIALSR